MTLFRTAALLVTTGLVVLQPTHAFAASRVHIDATKDVVSTSFEDEDEVYAPAPDRRNGDIRGVYVTHGRHAVTVTLRFVELSNASTGVGTALRFNTNQGRRDLFAFGPGFNFMMKGNGSEVRCRVKTNVSFANDRVRVVTPRKCLDNPRWVRVGAATYTLDDEEELVFLDDAHRNQGAGDDLRLGRKVRR